MCSSNYSKIKFIIGFQRENVNISFAWDERQAERVGEVSPVFQWVVPAMDQT